MADALTGGRWSRREDVVWRQAVGNVVLQTSAHQEPVVLSESGALVWQLLAAPRSFDDLLSALSERVQIPSADLEGDVRPLLEELATLGACRRDPW